jgi:hypothetical protein
VQLLNPRSASNCSGVKEDSILLSVDAGGQHFG